MPKGSPPAYENALAHFGGQSQPALQITDSFIPQVLKAADLNWKIP